MNPNPLSLQCAAAILLAPLLAVLLSGCLPSPHSPGAGREAELRAQKTRHWLLARDQELKSPLLEKLLARISRRLDPLNTWQISVSKAPQVNAFSLGNRQIVLSLGLLRDLENETQLAAVLAHEMAHEQLGHIETLSQKAKANRLSPTPTYELELELAADLKSFNTLCSARYDLMEVQPLLGRNYRRFSENVSTNFEEGLKKRLEELEESRQNCRHSLLGPALNNRDSREFYELKKNLP